MSRLVVMAFRAEDMSFDELKTIVDPLCCRWTDLVSTPELPRGSFDMLTFPITELTDGDSNPTVHSPARHRQSTRI